MLALFSAKNVLGPRDRQNVTHGTALGELEVYSS